jgi:UV DNA damage endonuclease
LSLIRSPNCHVFSRRDGWGGGDPRPHAEFVDPGDMPRFWRDRAMTVDVEAKAKEVAVLRLMGALAAEGRL